MSRDPPASWQRLPKSVIGHVTESLCINALGRCACVGDYKLKSAVATAWCRLAGRGDRNAGVAVEGLRRAARERELQREEAQHEQLRLTLADTPPVWITSRSASAFKLRARTVRR